MGKRVCVIGGGPAGITAAYSAALKGDSAELFEKNEKLGKKLYLTGKGRCNLTNAAPIEDYFENIVSNSSFLYSALYTFGNKELIELMSKFGLQTKVERGNRVFPCSDKSSDVIKALAKAVSGVGVKVNLNSKIQGILTENKRVRGILCEGRKIPFDSVIIATGGLSYPSTGSTGDGYEFARYVGHSITAPKASLVGVDTTDDVGFLAGLTLKNVGLNLIKNNKCIYKEQGEMLFTHTGVSGPLVLTASAYMQDGESYEIAVDLKPALDLKTLDARLIRDFAEKSNKDLNNVLAGLLPAKLIPLMIFRLNMDARKKANSITREERAYLTEALKSFSFKVKGKRPIEEAVITRGGVKTSEIDPSTMESKLCHGLFFAGEVIDVDALTGGFNLQIAFSTGYLAGANC
jgi:predicted Rossmann fold flavoprotein